VIVFYLAKIVGIIRKEIIPFKVKLKSMKEVEVVYE